jgi:hypothetical protein
MFWLQWQCHEKFHQVRSIVHAVTLNEEQTNHMLSATRPISQHDCYYQAVDAFHEYCYNLGQHEYALRLIFGLANLCQSGFNADAIVRVIEDHCMATPNIEVH